MVLSPTEIIDNKFADDNTCKGVQQKQQTTLATQQEQLAQRIQYTDDRINKLIYELHGLSEEEVRIVEGENSK